MAVPAGYELLARIGFVDKGTYAAGTTYMAGDVVYYNGSTWTALKDNLKGVTPAQGANWRYMARGFEAELLSDVTAKDTEGLAGTAGASVGAQVLMDAIADKVATKLLLKSDVVNQIINDATKAASAASLYNVNQAVTQLNSNLGNFGNRIQSVKYFASTDNAGEYAWVGVSLSDFGITGKKLAAYPAIICCVNELTGAPGFYVTHANRLHDTSFNVVFNKGRAEGFILACSFVIEDA